MKFSTGGLLHGKMSSVFNFETHGSNFDSFLIKRTHKFILEITPLIHTATSLRAAKFTSKQYIEKHLKNSKCRGKITPNLY